MRTAISLLMATVALSTWLHGRAAACSCVPPDYSRNYADADHVVRVQAIGSLGGARGQITYLGLTKGEAFKGCLPEHSLTLVRTASDGAACGFLLEPGEDYLLQATAAGYLFGLPVLRVNLCDGSSAWADLPASHLDFLNRRNVCCGEDCGCLQDDEVQCLVDPCEVSSCDVEGASCIANYCGGCNAEWTDESGTGVCMPEPGDPEEEDEL